MQEMSQTGDDQIFAASSLDAAAIDVKSTLIDTSCRACRAEHMRRILSHRLPRSRAFNAAIGSVVTVCARRRGTTTTCARSVSTDQRRGH